MSLKIEKLGNSFEIEDNGDSVFHWKILFTILIDFFHYFLLVPASAG